MVFCESKDRRGDEGRESTRSQKDGDHLPAPHALDQTIKTGLLE